MLRQLIAVFICQPEALAGDAPCGTELHVDPTHALTLLVALVKDRETIDPKEVYAYWLFIRPPYVGEVIAWARRQWDKLEVVRNQPDACVLTYDQMQAIAEHFGPEKVDLVPHHHGQIMHVPAGWAHGVLNVRECAKVAIEGVYNDCLHLYAISYDHYRRTNSTLLPKDYPCWFQHAVEIAIE